MAPIYDGTAQTDWLDDYSAGSRDFFSLSVRPWFVVAGLLAGLAWAVLS